MLKFTKLAQCMKCKCMIHLNLCTFYMSIFFSLGYCSYGSIRGFHLYLTIGSDFKCIPHACQNLILNLRSRQPQCKKFIILSLVQPLLPKLESVWTWSFILNLAIKIQVVKYMHLHLCFRSWIPEHWVLGSLWKENVYVCVVHRCTQTCIFGHRLR